MIRLNSTAAKVGAPAFDPRHCGCVSAGIFMEASTESGAAAEASLPAASFVGGGAAASLPAWPEAGCCGGGGGGAGIGLGRVLRDGGPGGARGGSGTDVVDGGTTAASLASDRCADPRAPPWSGAMGAGAANAPPWPKADDAAEPPAPTAKCPSQALDPGRFFRAGGLSASAPPPRFVLRWWQNVCLEITGPRAEKKRLAKTVVFYCNLHDGRC